MKTIVVIGGIGSGKSSVSRGFVRRGAAFIDLDEVGHDILTHTEVIDDLVEAFGEDICDADGAIIRSALAAKAFETPEQTAVLNGITHPRLIAEALERLHTFEAEGRLATVIEISPYDGPDGSFGVFTKAADAVVAVVAPPEVRIARAVVKGFPEADVRNRIARQASDYQRRTWSDYVIENDSTLEALDVEIGAVWNAIVGMA